MDGAAATAVGAARLRLDGWGAAVAANYIARGGAATMTEADDEETDRAEREYDDDDNGDASAAAGSGFCTDGRAAFGAWPVGDHGARRPARAPCAASCVRSRPTLRCGESAILHWVCHGSVLPCSGCKLRPRLEGECRTGRSALTQ